MRRGKQVYYRESSDDDENVVANLTDSAEDEKVGSEDEMEYAQATYIEEDILSPNVSTILTWRTERAVIGSSDTCNLTKLIYF